jgi:hypothetical protein
MTLKTFQVLNTTKQSQLKKGIEKDKISQLG